MDDLKIVGADELLESGRAMMKASQIMAKGAGTIDSAITAQMQYLENWIEKFEGLVERLENVILGFKGNNRPAVGDDPKHGRPESSEGHGESDRQGYAVRVPDTVDNRAPEATDVQVGTNDDTELRTELHIHTDA